MRALRSAYLHWAKTQAPVTYNLAASDMPHVRLDGLPLTLAELDLDGASHPRYAPLREAVAGHCGVTADMVVTAEGTSGANFLALAALVSPGDEVLVEAPTYEPLLAALGFLGAHIRRVARRDAEDFRLHPDDVAAALTDRTRLVVLCNLHNPTGAYSGPVDLAAIGAAAAAVGARVLVDEVYLDAVSGARTAALLGPQFVATGSLTKVYGLSGLRCGWVLAAPELAERMWRLYDVMGANRPHQAERLGCFAFAQLPTIIGDGPARLARNRALFDAFVAARGDLSCMPSRHGLTVFPRWTGGDTAPLDALLRANFDAGVVPGHWFEMPDRFRVSLTGADDLLAEGLVRLGRALDRLGQAGSTTRAQAAISSL